jgi:hypothetical protein
MKTFKRNTSTQWGLVFQIPLADGSYAFEHKETVAKKSLAGEEYEVFDTVIDGNRYKVPSAATLLPVGKEIVAKGVAKIKGGQLVSVMGE